MHLRHWCSSVLHHLTKTHWFVTLSFFVIIGNWPKNWSRVGVFRVIPIFPAFSIVNFAIRILKPFFVTLNFVFLWFAIGNGKEFFQTINISSFTVRSIIIFFPTFKIIIFTSWKIIELLKTFNVFFTIFTWNIKCFSPTLFIIFFTGIAVIFRNAIISLLLVANILHKTVFYPTVPIIPLTFCIPSFSLPAFYIIRFAGHIQVFFETWSILAKTVPKWFYPTIVVIILAFFRVADSNFPAFDIIIFTIWKAIPFLPTGSVFITMWIKRIR